MKTESAMNTGKLADLCKKTSDLYADYAQQFEADYPFVCEEWLNVSQERRLLEKLLRDKFPLEPQQDGVESHYGYAVNLPPVEKKIEFDGAFAAAKSELLNADLESVTAFEASVNACRTQEEKDLLQQFVNHAKITVERLRNMERPQIQ